MLLDQVDPSGLRQGGSDRTYRINLKDARRNNQRYTSSESRDSSTVPKAAEFYAKA